jgi:hypothetical protein
MWRYATLSCFEEQKRSLQRYAENDDRIVLI